MVDLMPSHPERWNAVAVLCHYHAPKVSVGRGFGGRTNLKSIGIIGFPFAFYPRFDVGELWLVGVRPNLYGALATVRLNLLLI